MRSIDWRELYASNQAAIARGTAPPLPAGGTAVRHASPSRAHRSGPRVHVPAGAGAGDRLPLVCLLHGCTQDAAGIAIATAMDAAADRHGFVAVYPEQSRGANPQACWNWFQAAHRRRGSGEPAAIAAAVQGAIDAAAQGTIDPSRVFVAGLSSGGAMAAILGAAYPDLFRAVAVHSGLPYGAADDVGEAFAAMARGPAHDAEALGARAFAAMGAHARVVPSLVIHGTQDRTVAPVNARAVLEQGMVANRLGGADAAAVDPARPAEEERLPGARPAVRSRWRDRDGRLLHELLLVDGLGHAWSGGAAGVPHTDPAGPPATEAIWRFFAAVAPAEAPGRPALTA